MGTTPVTGTVTYSGVRATFTPSAVLAVSSSYTATLTTTVKSSVGTALAAAKTWSFTTAAAPDLTPPTVTSTTPASSATGVDYSASILAVFSEPMDSATVTTSSFTVTLGAATISGAVSYSGTTATFNPSANLSANTTYTATVTTAATDLVGNHLATNKVWTFTTGSSRSVVSLGTAGTFVILAESAITNSPTSTITGDVGISPAAESYITGFYQTDATGYATANYLTGKIYAADMAAPTPTNLTTAVHDMVLAYDDAAGRLLPDYLAYHSGNIGGLTLGPGLYKWTGNVTAPTNVTLNGSSTDVWIFQIAGNLSVSPSVTFTLTGGAAAKNIFWQVAGDVNLTNNAVFQGIILSKTAITLETNVRVTGRLLSQTAVSLDQVTLVNP
jgi:hypothetical protein